jgi:hypothetical protein
MKRILAFIFLSAVLLLPLATRAVPGDEHWDPQFNWPGTTNVILAIGSYGGKIYAGGYMVAMFPTNAPLMMWDGAQWSTVASFTYGNNNPTINDIVTMNGALYVAGTFTNVNGVGITGLAKWDGNSWSSVGLSGSVAGLAVDGNNLYAAGAFTNADGAGVIMTNIGYFDGSAWHALGSGVGTPGNGFARTVAVKSGLVYAGGYFTNCGAQSITNMAVWNGTSWSSVGGGIGSLIVYSLAFNGSDLYVGGVITSAGSTPVSNIARWDGANWWAVGNGLAGSGAAVDSLAVFNGSLCAGGSFTNSGSSSLSRFAVWNGSSWSSANGGVSATVYRIFNNGTNAYVGGNLLLANNKLMDSITTWDGTSWNQVGTVGQLNGIYAVARALASDGTNLYAAGASLNWAEQTNLNLIGRFDGTNWSSPGTGITGSGVISGPLGTGVYALALTNKNLYAGGYFTNAGGVAVTNMARWNGAAWSAMGNPGGVVAAILVRTDYVYVAGAPFYNTTLFGAPFFEYWDGANWQGVNINYPPNTDTGFFFADPNFGMNALASIGTNIFIGGHFSIGEYANFPSGYTNCNNIMRFDGSYGWVMGTGLNSNVTSMAVMGANLYVAGMFTNAGGIAASKIALWNGGYWTNLSSGVVGSGVINALAVSGGNLYVGGSFTNMGGTPVNRIAQWDGTNWTALGNGITFPGTPSATVNGLGVSGNSLYVSGNFRMAGDKPSFYVARWNGLVNYNTPQLINPAFANHQFHMRLAGISGQTNIILATTNFSSWTPVFTNTAGIYDFTDTNSSYRFRYYRAMLGP